MEKQICSPPVPGSLEADYKKILEILISKNLDCIPIAKRIIDQLTRRLNCSDKKEVSYEVS